MNEKDSAAADQQVLLKEILDFEDFRLPSMQNRGFALIGGTGFDKLKFVKKYLNARGFAEAAGKETAGRYSVIDCLKLRGYADLTKTLVKNQNAAYIIFNNCDSLLKHDWALQAFKHLSEEYSGLTIITENDEAVNFKTEASFVFLGKENTLHVAVEKETSKGLGASAYNHFDGFIHYIHVYDFDKRGRYYGHDVPPIFN